MSKSNFPDGLEIETHPSHKRSRAEARGPHASPCNKIYCAYFSRAAGTPLSLWLFADE
jgi:hypothetical protein